MNPLRDAALHYAGRIGWHVLRLHTTIQGRCTCRNPDCEKPGKHPWALTHGLKEATRDRDTIERWWREKPHANVGVTTGNGLVVVDIDSHANAKVLEDLAKAYEPFPDTLQVHTGRGVHLYFAGDVGGSHTIGPSKLLIRGHGAYMVVPPSLHFSGCEYTWKDNAVLPAPLPEWFRQWVITNGNKTQQVAEPAIVLGPRSPWIMGAIDLTDRALSGLVEKYTLDEILEQLIRIPASTNMDEWLNVARALHDWDAGDLGLHIFLAWSASSDTPKHQTPEAQQNAEKEWHRIKKQKPGKKMIRIATLFVIAARYPAKKLQKLAPTTGQFNGNHAAPVTEFAGPGIIRKVVWIDTDDEGTPRPTCANAAVAIEGLGVWCRNDVFHDRLMVGGHFIQQWAGDLTDNAVLMLRRYIKIHFRFDPGERNTRDAAVQLCLENPVNPVVDYLDDLAWDGRPRVARWVVDYLGAPDHALTREFGRLMLVAAVRRARHPGAKFDQVVVMEGPEGRGKSTALRILAGDENFSDQRILGTSDREQLEASAGIWIHEIGELAGMKRAEVEAIKVFASRTVDRARPAYGRFRVDRPRQTIFVGTTNSQTYLKSDTGDRRFWPLPTEHIDLRALERDRDQLWAEAARMETIGESLTLDWRLWPDAARVQASRQEIDPWTDAVRDYIDKKQCQDTSIKDVLEMALRLELGKCGQTEQNRAARVLRNLGFTRYHKREGNRFMWRYKVETPGTVGTSGHEKDVVLPNT